MDMKIKFVYFGLGVLFLAHFGESQNATFDITKYGATANADISEVSHAFFFPLIILLISTYFHQKKKITLFLKDE